MFSKNSRYRKLPDEVTLDAKGRQLLSKSLRLLPEVTGRFRHALDENDRLDHLAYKYYKQPRKWWHICDANPDFLSPHDLLGTTPIISQRFPVSFGGSGDAPWAVLLADTSQQPAFGQTDAAGLLAAGMYPGGVVLGGVAATGNPEMTELCQGLYEQGTWFVTGEGEIAANDYGHVLKARQTVTIKGIGETHSGVYYVTHVTHSFTTAERATHSSFT